MHVPAVLMDLLDHSESLVGQEVASAILQATFQPRSRTLQWSVQNGSFCFQSLQTVTCVCHQLCLEKVMNNILMSIQFAASHLCVLLRHASMVLIEEIGWTPDCFPNGDSLHILQGLAHACSFPAYRRAGRSNCGSNSGTKPQCQLPGISKGSSCEKD